MMSFLLKNDDFWTKNRKNRRLRRQIITNLTYFIQNNMHCLICSIFSTLYVTFLGQCTLCLWPILSTEITSFNLFKKFLIEILEKIFFLVFLIPDFLIFFSWFSWFPDWPGNSISWFSWFLIFLKKVGDTLDVHPHYNADGDGNANDLCTQLNFEELIFA